MKGRPPGEERLSWPEETIERIADHRLNTRGAGVVRIFVMQPITEWRLRLTRQINFRKRENAEAREAYREMAIPEFEWINARQKWANWRTIPKNLSGHLPARPLKALDLCCGTGDSTEVLACFLAPGSTIVGLEFNPAFVERARARTYTHADGTACTVVFRAQSVLEPFRDMQSAVVASASQDLVNSCGAVGHHFDADGIGVLAAECHRVLRPGGLATIDAGLPGDRRKQVRATFLAVGFQLVRAARSHVLDPYLQYCFRKPAA